MSEQRAAVRSERAVLSELLSGRHVVVFDGAMGTMLRAAGVDLGPALCEVNLSRPGLVRDVHRAYLAAGAQIVQTNTFDGNRRRLGRGGLQDRVSEINIAAARLAREAIEASEAVAFVAGSVGPVMGATLVPRASAGERDYALREQVAALADWVDLIVLETFGDIESLAAAVESARAECDLPVIAQLTFGDDARTLRGEEPGFAAAELSALDVAAIGANCTVGPAVLQEVVAALAAGCRLPVSVQPNAGQPRRVGRQLHYPHNVEYFAAAARELVGNGAGLVGGCCGTTPAHIRAVAHAVGQLRPAAAPERPAAHRTERPTLSVARAAPARPKAPWQTGDRAVLVGLRAPRDSGIDELVELAKQVLVAGVDEFVVLEPEAPSVRVSPVSAGVLLQERLGARVLFEIDAADRNLAAIQADVLGAHALGLRVVICRTGAPRGAGDYPDYTDGPGIDSVRLVAALAGLNEGLDWRGVPMNGATAFIIGATVSITSDDRQHELERVAQKVRAGAHFLLADPSLDAAATRAGIEAIRESGIGVPILLSLAPFDDPLMSTRLAHEQAGAHPALPPGTLADPIDSALDYADRTSDLAAGILVQTTNRGPSAALADLTGLLARLVAAR